VEYARSALYLDFDNVFTGLFGLNPEVAIQFASSPETWLRRLSTTLTVDAPRRWLILRCYLNPAGWVNHYNPAGEPSRLQFFRFRSAFIRAGFEVVDCPPYNSTKNGADIRIVVDAIDALSADTRYDEFVIASGDSDMTPLLQRLRRADRRTMIVSAVDSAEAFTSIADRVLGSRRLLALVQGGPVDCAEDFAEGSDGNFAGNLAGEGDGVAAAESGGADGEIDGKVDGKADGEIDGKAGGEVVPAAVVPADQTVAYEAFRSAVVARYNDASAPLNMAALADQLRSELGQVVDETDWFGFGGFARAVRSLKLPNLRMSQHEIWDESRHSPPEGSAAVAPRVSLPEPVERLVELINLPRLPQEWWPPIYQALSVYAHTHHFNLAQCTNWSRDWLREKGFAVDRATVMFVVRGISRGCPLNREPPPTAAEIGAAFVDNVLGRAYGDAYGETFTEDEVATIRTWLGVYS